MAGSAGAIAIVVFAAYKSTQSRTETVTESSSPVSSTVGTAFEEPIAVPVEGTRESTNPVADNAPEIIEATSTPASPDEATTPQQEVPSQVINFAARSPAPSFVSSATISEAPVAEQTPIVQPVDTVAQDSFPATAAEKTEEAPSPFPEETFSSTPQTPAPTDVSAVQSISAPNSTSSTASPVLVISTPKRRQTRTRKIPSTASGAPRKRRSTKPKQPVQTAGLPGASSETDTVQRK